MKQLDSTAPLPLFDTLQHCSLHNQQQQQQSIPYPDDYRYAHEFLYSYRGSEATYNAYRREVERLLHWSWRVANKSIDTLKRADFELFIEFCQHPPKAWISTSNVARFINKNGERIPNKKWRPFVASVSKVAHRQGQSADVNRYLLSQKALQAIFSVLGSFYNFLLQEEFVEINPVAQIRQKSRFIQKEQTKQVIRRLSELQWTYVMETAETMAAENPQQHERTLFIMSALYGMYLRISELVATTRWQPEMGDFQKDLDGNWWFTTVGKGNKRRMISVSDAMLKALKRYRQSLSLPALPTPGETTPLICKNSSNVPITSTRMIRRIVQDCFDRARDRMVADGLSEEAIQLEAATVHWLRHTGISDDVKVRPREHVRDDAGHGSSAITDKYIDIELRERHASAKNKKIK